MRTNVVIIGLFALAKLLVHLATYRGYGYFRDELYYLACADHLAWGYVDHPPLSVFVLDLVRHVLEESQFALRMAPALLGAGTVALVGRMALALGGGRWSAIFAMTSALVAPVYLAINHYYSMNAFDQFFWALAAFVLIRVLDDPRRARPWMLLGIVLGLGLLNKVSVLWLGAGIAVGLLMTSATRRALLSRSPSPWPWVAGAIAAAMFAPHIIWQMRNGWPTAEFIRNATTQKMVAVAPLDFVTGQVMMMLPFTLPLWLAGLAYLLFHPAATRYRALAWMYLTVFAILLFNGSSRSAYLAPAYTWLFAAGGVAIERWLAPADAHAGGSTRAAALPRPQLPRRQLPGPRLQRLQFLRLRLLGLRLQRLRLLRPALAALLLVLGAAIAPLALPVLPVDAYIAYARALGQRPSTEERNSVGELGQFYADMHGWPEIASQVAAVYRQLPPTDLAPLRIFAPDYGVAGAIDIFGPRAGLPRGITISGHNNYWLWGPGAWDGRTMIMVGGDETRLRAAFDRVERAGTIACGRCMPYENSRPIWILHGLRMPVADFWTRVKHYD